MSIRVLFGLSVSVAVCSGADLTVTGTFKCVDNREPNSLAVIVELMEEDDDFLFGSKRTMNTHFHDADDKLGEIGVNYMNGFEVTGHEWEFGHLEPYLNIHHRCGQREEEPWKTFRYQLDPVPNRLFGSTDARIDTGVIDLNKH